MKIVFCTPRFWPNTGGVETHVLSISKVLIAGGHTVSVVTVQTHPSQKLSEKYEGIEVYRMPVAEHSKVSVWKWIFLHAQLFCTADVVHAHDVAWWLAPLWICIAHKYYTTFHGWEGKFPVPPAHKVHRFIAAQASLQTIHIGDYIQKFYWDTPSLVLYGGVELPKKLPARASENVPHIVFLGRLERENDISEYCALFTHIQAHIPTCSITWVGDGSLRSECEKVGRVTGMVSNPGEYMVNADIVCAASYLSLFEALAQGKEVIALATSDLKKEYVRSFPLAEFLITGSDTAAVLERAVAVLKRPGKARKDAVELRMELQNYTWRRVAEQYLKLWGNT